MKNHSKASYDYFPTQLGLVVLFGRADNDFAQLACFNLYVNIHAEITNYGNQG
jgi:hypothetical protein